MVVVSDCTFVITETRIFYSGYNLYPDRGYGVFQYSDNDWECVEKHDDAKSRERWARFFGVMTVMFLTAVEGMIIVCMFCKIPGIHIIWMTMRIMLSLTTPLQAEPFAVFAPVIEKYDDGSLYSYWIGPDGIIASINVVLLCIVSILAWVAKSPNRASAPFSELSPPVKVS